MTQKSMVGARVRLWVGVVLVLAGSGLGFAGSWLWLSGRGSFLTWNGLALVAAVLGGVGASQIWSGLAGIRFLFGRPGMLIVAGAISGWSGSIFSLVWGLSRGYWETVHGSAWLIDSMLLLQALSLTMGAITLYGNSRGLTMWSRYGLRPIRIPWADIDRVVFTAGLQPKTIEIGVALRSGAKPRRSSTRRSDVLLDLPCRVAVLRKQFDLPALQRLLAEAGRPEIALVERSGGMERPWPYPVATPVNRVPA